MQKLVGNRIFEIRSNADQTIMAFEYTWGSFTALADR